MTRRYISPSSESPNEILESFANLDHRRASRTGFPEAVFGQGKTPLQIHSILDSMANNVNALTEADQTATSTAIIATRIDPDIYEKVKSIGPLKHGQMTYHQTARIISVQANSLMIDASSNKSSQSTPAQQQSIVVACAGTTDLPVAEEAAMTLSLSGVPVTRIYDCGVAGLHRIIAALPNLRDPNVGCVIVCAGMDGALPSVVGGLVDVPVVAIPTSVGYGMNLGGMSALLTMLNSCSPGVGVVNVDNGFGGAVWAMKCLRSKQK
jgi:NCAIR mutase (PurE)-related protein